MNESFTPPKQRDTRRFVARETHGSTSRVPGWGLLVASRLPRCCFLRSSLDVCFPNPPSRPRFPRSLHPRSSCAQPSCTSRRSRCRAQLALVCRHAWRSPKIAWSRAPTRRALPTQMVAELGEMVGVRSKPKIAEDITQLMHACSEKTRAPAPGWQGRLSPTDPPTAAGTRRCSSSGGRAMGSTRRSC